jgi:hypothetical protein
VAKRKKQTQSTSLHSIHKFGSEISQDIVRVFFGPLIEQVKGIAEYNQVLAYLMGEGRRYIEFFRLSAPITGLRGLYSLNDGGLAYCETRGLRNYAVDYQGGWYVGVRYDTRANTYVDLEFFRNWNEKDSYQFRLTCADFLAIMDKLKPLKMNQSKIKELVNAGVTGYRNKERPKIIRRPAGTKA